VENMAKPKISLFASIGKDSRALGYKGDLIWRISEDLKRFKSLTMGHPIIMGRKTHESIGKALPGRLNIIITRNENYLAPDCIIVSSLEEALKKAQEVEKEEIFIIGGGEIYREAIKDADRLYLTVVDSDAPADTYFPEYEKDFTKIIEARGSSEGNLTYTYLTLER
jgi:dihydrofolate reductase